MARTAERLVDSVLNNTPLSPGAMVDFGLDGYGGGDPNRRYRALYYAITYSGVTADQLHSAALTPGELTKLIRENNPDKEVEFVTANDMIGPP